MPAALRPLSVTKAEQLITQRKFELKNELTKELATKEDIATLKGEIKTLRQEMKAMYIALDRKYLIMYLIMLFTIIFLNQNALVFIAKLLGIMK
ncbi:MAG: hypothetical protein D6814_11980 [Calditrichaeota bacterium]|nr:MAG: hypothetical protein D6814_11980 [Calditrichota bacterium]